MRLETLPEVSYEGAMSNKSVSRLPFLFAVLFVLLAFLRPIHAVAQDAADSTSSSTTATAPPAESGQVPPRESTPAMETASSTYRLQPYDLIDVDVYSEEDLHKPARLGADGTALLPLIGSLKLGGLTVAEATDLVRNRYAAGFVKNPNVLITVMQYRKSTFSILGEVTKPGIYEIPEGAHVSIIEAISLASGYLPTADQNNVLVKRTVDGKSQSEKIRAADMAQDPGIVPYEILPGDTIVVPSKLYHKSAFSILGQVTKPGNYEIPDGAHVTIIDAISLAGGFMAGASQNTVAVKRMVGDKLSIIQVRAGDMIQNAGLVPFEVKPGDIILVQYGNSTFSILGQVEKPGIYAIAEGSNLDIINAILMAGGYTRSAAQNSVTVKRIVNGTATILKVRAGDMAQNPNVPPFEVQAGDVIKVNESWF
jgi:polysaccharide export outer membrane protein